MPIKLLGEVSTNQQIGPFAGNLIHPKDTLTYEGKHCTKLICGLIWKILFHYSSHVQGFEN